MIRSDRVFAALQGLGVLVILSAAGRSDLGGELTQVVTMALLGALLFGLGFGGRLLQLHLRRLRALERRRARLEEEWEEPVSRSQAA